MWEIAKANLSWGGVRIANQLGVLSVFLTASTVRNVLNRPKPPTAAAEGDHVADEARADLPRSIRTPYPNSIWSIDKTTVLGWGLWPISILVAIDHFSRKAVAVVPLEGPNSGPNDFYCRDVPEPVPHDAKVVPPKIERRRFAKTRVTGFRLLRAA